MKSKVKDTTIWSGVGLYLIMVPFLAAAIVNKGLEEICRREGKSIERQEVRSDYQSPFEYVKKYGFPKLP